ncbi:MAG: DMT family protein [Acidobacteria bacterium]|nr:DMT family protein [Acidobacteriota bacterium]
MRFFVLFFIAVTVQAQVRYHFGDDPRWAASDFDDSAWPVVENDSLPAPPKQGDGFLWVRQRMSAPAGDAALWLRLKQQTLLPNFPVELRVDGAYVGSSGRLPPDAYMDSSVYEKVYDLPAGGEAGVRSVLVARRIWVPSSLRGETVSLPKIEVGSRDGMRLAALRARDAALQAYLLVVLYHIRKAEWSMFAAIGISWLIALPEYCLQVPANRLGSLQFGGPFTTPQLKIMQEAITIGVFAIFSLFVLKERLRPNDWIAFALVIFRFVLGLTVVRWIPQSWSVFGVPVELQDNFQILLFLTMAWVLFRGVWRTWLERQGLSAEFEAAREMQQALVQRVPETPGLAVEFAYLPASQVGGDFYRVFPADDGATLVVVGDVSGKGLKAAMTVAGLVCAMEAIRTRRPGGFLEELNGAAKAYMQSGFVTCCAVLIRPNGESVIANAGHPSPYCDGRELETEPGLPLGIAAGAEYPQSFTHGESFTFVSDGVVEAENANRELFGFDRTREISTRSAHEIANAAKAWGQTDDITVVTVRRNA